MADVVADEAEADAAESLVDAAADGGEDGAEAGGEGTDGGGDGGGDGEAGSEDDEPSLTSEQNQGGTYTVFKGDEIYSYYITGALLQIPADTPADVVSAILQKYDVLYALG